MEHLNGYFSSVFTREILSKEPVPIFSPENDSDFDLKFDESDVSKLWTN